MADLSAAGRRRHAQRGQALPDGSFPITNRQDLLDAIKLAGHAKDPAKARRFIIRRARQLGLSDLIPDSWSAGGSSSKRK